MGTLPPPATKLFPEDSLEKKVITRLISIREYLPIENDRNRLGYALFKIYYRRGR